MKFTKLLIVHFAISLTVINGAFGQGTPASKLEDYTVKLRITPGMVMVCPIFGGHDSNGRLIGDYDDTVTVTKVSEAGIEFDWNMTYPAQSSGHRLVRTEDLQKSQKVSVFYWPGENGARVGYSDTFRISDVLYAGLKSGKKTPMSFDGTQDPVSIQKVGEEDLAALVNERKVKIHAIKGKTANGWLIWVLDNPAYPIMVKGHTMANWTVPSFTYPGTSEKDLVRQLQQKGVATTHAVLFAFNSADLRNESEATLNAVASYLKSNPALQMEIEGHTDNVGTAQLNAELSKSRAESVKAYLMREGGIAAARLTTSGRGSSQPVASNGIPEGRALNRRVVFRERVHK